MKVLHVLDHSLPHHSGYAFRSESIIRAQRALGVDTVHVTSAKHEHDGAHQVEHVADLSFLRLPEVVSGGSPRDQVRCVSLLRRHLKRLVREHRPDIVHCHSPCLNGLAALHLGVPVVYEVRACWEDAAVSSGTTTEGSARYRASRMLETFVARMADGLVVICNGLRDEFLARGVDPARVRVVGNGVDPTTLPSSDREAVRARRASVGDEHSRIIGFFGSFYGYEGLELLMESLPDVIAEVPEARVLLAGGGEAEPAIVRAAQRLGLSDHVTFLGRVSHEEIGSCYGAADVMVFPRLRMKITDMVTPLKPLEAMYLKRPVVASDVGGHRELIDHGSTGLLFEAGNAAGLSRALIEVLSNDGLAGSLSIAGHRYVMEERLWSHMAARYLDLYERVLEGRPSRALAG